MRKKIVALATAITLVLSLFMGCGNKEVEPEIDEEDVQDVTSDGRTIINLWSYFGGLEDVVSQFEAANPDIKVEVKVFTYDEYELAYKESMLLDKGKADLFIIDSNDYGNFNSVVGLEDLSKPEYDLMKYKDDFDVELWEVGKSLDKKEILGLPIASAPLVTYYRKDILEKYGFPGEPYELAAFMEEPENWLKIATTLKADGINVVQWYSEIIRFATSDIPYFNENLEYQKDTEEFKKAVEITVEAQKRNLAAHNDIWSPLGNEMLKDNKFAMLYLGSWGSSTLQELVPEQEGLWRVTSLPFGVHGWNNASILSMAKNSSKKDAAKRFLEFYLFEYSSEGRIGNVAGYLPFTNLPSVLESENKFLGGQKEQKLYEDTMSVTKEYAVTSLDEKAFAIWDEQVNKGIENGLSADEIMVNITNEIKNKLEPEIKILKEQMEKSKK